MLPGPGHGLTELAALRPLLGTLSEAEIQQLTARGAAMIGSFSEVFGVMLMTTFANHERVNNELYQLQVNAAAGRNVLDPVEISLYKALQKSYSDASRTLLSAMVAVSKIDYRHKSDGKPKQDA